MEKTIGLKRVLGNSIWQIGEKIITMLFSVVVTSIVARYLGVEQYGMINYIISTVMLFTAFSTLGMERITIKDILEREDSKENILGTSLYIRIIGGIILLVISQITIYILNKKDILAQILGLIVGTSMLFRAFEVIEYYLQSQMKQKTISIVRFCATTLVAISRILVVVYDLGIIGFTATYLIESIVVALLLQRWYKKHIKLRSKFSKAYAKKILSRCWYVAISGLMITLYMRIDQVMLGTMLNSKIENGIYSAAVRIAEIWYFIPTAIVTAFQPMIVLSKKNDEIQYNKNVQRLYDIISLISILFAIGISIFGKFIVLVLYGEEYYGAVDVLNISAWAGLFATLGTARSLWLFLENLQKYTLVYTIAGCMVNIFLNYILIPQIGAKGAAIATLVSQFVTNIIALMPFKKTRKSSFMILKSIFYNQTIIDIFKRLVNIFRIKC